MELYGRFDGKVIVLTDPPPADWKPDQIVKVTLATEKDEELFDDTRELLLKIAAEALPGLPPDLSEQHDHYLYGTPKRTEASSDE